MIFQILTTSSLIKMTLLVEELQFTHEIISKSTIQISKESNFEEAGLFPSPTG